MITTRTRPLHAVGTHGSIKIGTAVRAAARTRAAEDFAECQLQGFTGDAVRDLVLPAWLDGPEHLLPLAELLGLRLGLREDRPIRLYATCGVDWHIDEIDGLMVAVVLHSDGFTFEQGRTQLKLAVGDWFVFDDNLEHAVTESREATTLLVLAAALQER